MSKICVNTKDSLICLVISLFSEKTSDSLCRLYRHQMSFQPTRAWKMPFKAIITAHQSRTRLMYLIFYPKILIPDEHMWTSLSTFSLLMSLCGILKLFCFQTVVKSLLTGFRDEDQVLARTGRKFPITINDVKSVCPLDVLGGDLAGDAMADRWCECLILR